MRRVVKFDVAAGTAVTGTATETAAASYAFGIGELQPGRVINYECLVRCTVPNADTQQIRVRFGTSATPTANTAIATGTATVAVADHIVTVRGSLHVHSATRMVHCVLMDNPPALTGVPNPESFYNIFVSTADTAYNLQITVDWTTGGAASSQSEAWVVYEDEV